jgi:uncharacterized protein (UPF0276 family)
MPGRPAAATPAGVGIAFNPPLAAFVAQNRDLLDFIEISPERFWHDRGPAQAGPDRYAEIAEAVALLDAARGDLPILAHGVGLSIATAGPLDLGHVDQIARWHDRYGFAWYSEHLAWSRLGPEEGWRGIGLMLPPVYDRATLDDLVPKVRAVCDRLGLPVLLENAVDYTPVADTDLGEAAFLAGLTARTPARLLLDLHNVHTNALSGGPDPRALIAALDLTLVREIHIAGGELLDGVWTDSHSGRCPAEVWDLLAEVLARPNGVRAITLEIDESYATRLDPGAIRAELETARRLWRGRAAA